MTENKSSKPRILGIDPGTNIAGYGIVEWAPNGVLKPIAMGVWKLNSTKPLAERLGTLAVEFRRVVDAFAPDIVCVELPFVANNARSALTLGTARGVVLAEAYLRGCIISEINPTAAKKQITGNGYASKEDVALFLSNLLKTKFAKMPLDATDALAIACAYALKERQAEAFAPQQSSAASPNKEVLNEWMKARKSRKRKAESFEQLIKQRSTALD